MRAIYHDRKNRQAIRPAGLVAHHKWHRRRSAVGGPAGIKTAVVSSSRNCQRVLAAGGLSDLFDARVDGVVAEQRGLKGKPDADTFLEAARELDVLPSRAIVVEDAVAGVRAGHAGGFRYVIGVAREGNAEFLRREGADIVVRDLEEIDVFAPTPS